MTLVLNSSEIKKCVHLNGQLIPIIEGAFKSLALGKTTMPPILRLDIEKYHGESDVKAAYIDGLDSYAIKVASGFFNNPNLGLPSSNGLMILLDSKTGVLKSVLLDKGYLTDVRTAIAGAIAAKHLSNPESSNVGIIGAGIQAKMQLEALLLVRNIKTAYIWSRDSKKTNTFVQNKECDYYIPDSQSQTSILGELNHAIKVGLVSAEKKYNELGSVIINSNLGRRNINDVTVADLTGTGVQDTAIARHTYKISADNGFGKMIK